MKTKRIWAMMGVLYVVIAFLLMLYWMATMQLIEGITGIMLFPAAAALSAQFWNRAWIIRHGRVGHVEEEDFQEPTEPQPGWGADAALGALFGVVAAALLVTGVMQLVNWFVLH